MISVAGRIARGYKAKFHAYGGVRAALRSYSPLELIDAGLRETWMRVGSLAWRLLPGRRRMKYGVLEALLFPAFDQWLRYEKVIEAVREIHPQDLPRILEVGCGSAGIVMFLKPGAARVSLTDQTEAHVIPSHCASAEYIRADGCNLPFADSSFPIVVSVDTLEHIPQAARASFLSELKRVTSDAVILACPLDSRDGRFQARACDEQLRDGLLREKRSLPRWLREHLERGHPTAEELTVGLSGARVTGWQSCEAWMRLQPLIRRPFLGLLSGLAYVLWVKGKDSVPPYYRGLCIWRKETVPESR